MNKTVKKLAIVLLALTPVMVVFAFAQRQGPDINDRPRHFNRGEMMMQVLPDLTDEQKEKIKELRLGLMKEALPIRNQIAENWAKLKTISTADPVDMKAIDKLIDENSILQASLKKEKAANHQEVRKLLTDEQRIVFDSRAGRGDRFGRRNFMKGNCRGGRNGDRPFFHGRQSQN